MSTPELLSLDDWLSPRQDAVVPLGYEICADGLVQGSSGPLSRRHAEHLVGYGFFAPDGDESGHWTVAPADCFRATRIYAWAREGSRARIESLCFGSDEQLLEGGSLPAELFACWATPRQFLALYAGLEAPARGFHRVSLKHTPAQPNFVVPLDFPTLSIGQWLTVRWSGALTALFVCGRELVPQQRPRASDLGPRPEQSNPDPSEPKPEA